MKLGWDRTDEILIWKVFQNWLRTGCQLVLSQDEKTPAFSQASQQTKGYYGEEKQQPYK